MGKMRKNAYNIHLDEPEVLCYDHTDETYVSFNQFGSLLGSSLACFRYFVAKICQDLANSPPPSCSLQQYLHNQILLQHTCTIHDQAHINNNRHLISNKNHTRRPHLLYPSTPPTTLLASLSLTPLSSLSHTSVPTSHHISSASIHTTNHQPTLPYLYNRTNPSESLEPKHLLTRRTKGRTGQGSRSKGYKPLCR